MSNFSTGIHAKCYFLINHHSSTKYKNMASDLAVVKGMPTMELQMAMPNNGSFHWSANRSIL